MPVNTNELINAIAIVSENHELRVTVTSSLKAAGVVGVATFLSAIVAGPVGIPIGATVGGLCAYQQNKGTFKSAAVIIRDELTDRQKNMLCESIINAFKEVRPEEIVMLIPLLLSPGAFQEVALTKIVSFITNELNMKVVSN